MADADARGSGDPPAGANAPGSPPAGAPPAQTPDVIEQLLTFDNQRDDDPPGGDPPPPPDPPPDMTPYGSPDTVVQIAGDSGPPVEPLENVGADLHYVPQTDPPPSAPPPAPDPPAPPPAPAAGTPPGPPVAATPDAIGQILSFGAPEPPPVPDMFLTTDDSGFTGDVQEIAGDSTGESSAPPPAPPASPQDFLNLDLGHGLPNPLLEDDDDGPEDVSSLASPWRIAAIVLVAVVVTVVGILLFNSGSSKSPAASSASGSSAPSATSSSAATTTSTPAAPSTAVPDVTLEVSLGQEDGTKLPLLFTVQAPANAPSEQTVELAFEGSGLPQDDTLVVGAGKSVTHTFTVTGCGSWKVRIAALDGKPVAAADAQQNGATRTCGG